MKKTLLILGFILLAFAPEKKTLRVEGDLQSWNILMDCLDKSNAPHTQVKAVQEWIRVQLNKQIKDSTK